MPLPTLWLVRNWELRAATARERGGEGRGVGAAGDGGHVVVPAHLKYVSILRLWYSICQPYVPSNHRITHNIIFWVSVKSPLATLTPPSCLCTTWFQGPRRAPEAFLQPQAAYRPFFLHSWYFCLMICMPHNSKGLWLYSRLLSVFSSYNESKIWVEFVRRAGETGKKTTQCVMLHSSR